MLKISDCDILHYSHDSKVLAEPFKKLENMNIVNPRVFLFFNFPLK